MFETRARRPRSPRHAALISGISLSVALSLAPLAQAAPGVRVFAAASLTDALDRAIAHYESRHDVDIVPVYASSSTAARQIARGAPADLFFSANVRWMDWLAEQGIELGLRNDVVQNRLAVIAARDSDLSDVTPGRGQALDALLDEGQRLAVGDPDHVPAGIYTRQALQALREWDALEPRLARADNVRAALALVERGETPLGIVYRTDAQASDKVRLLGLFPDDSHDPIVYPLALIDPPASDEARDFQQWLQGDVAQAIFSDFGFAPADDARR
ncbi:molybdate transport system substrate-binding protein [Modicisalibacter ilicicola DSM 19980]|uniref:Molybdate transport system substrate-binding protein n=1 Tax=Modicisalibacter ilicicola DSM 19980 TaxID=1121942 RepID=A0A1M5A1S5_9GAMM|nr:molybdate ABC transporter substrate-binding protein [Halomonas ilicicola]SHF24057.1 molybdate transport system substrate-binding protein [Halomonas ilicicola DSM 19980]